MPSRLSATIKSALLCAAATALLAAQDPLPNRPRTPDGQGEPGRIGQGPGGPNMPGMGPDRALVKEFDANRDGRLNRAERDAARASLARGGGGSGGFRGPRPPGMGEAAGPPNEPGIKLSPDVVKNVDPNASFYDEKVLRTIFLTFEASDWEDELAAFSHTDVDVPAKLVVDGKSYEEVGVAFRGMSSLMGVGKGAKRSLNLSIDHTNKKQRLLGYKNVNLLNAHEDPTLMRAVLYSHIARQYIPAPKCNFVRVVINGENWGIYTNAQQFDQTFIDENLRGEDGARWKVPGSPQADGGLKDLGEDTAAYKQRFEIKSGGDKDWKALANLCKVLNSTPVDKLEAALAPILDIDNVLRFLAIDVALVNGDGYWTRSSDYSIFCNKAGKFRVFPHDMNETFSFQGGMMGRGGGGPGGGRGDLGGPGGFGGPGGPGGGGGEPGGRRGFGPPGGNGGPDSPVDNGPEPRGRDGGGPPRGSGAPETPGGDGGEAGIPQGQALGARQAPAGIRVDPLVGLNNPRTPLRSKLLAVPALRERYLGYVRDIAERALDWQTLGPVVAGYRNLIDNEVKIDTRRLSGYEIFQRTTAEVPSDAVKQGKRNDVSLRSFANQRRAFLLGIDAVKNAALPAPTQGK